jgi:hypothetical protein
MSALLVLFFLEAWYVLIISVLASPENILQLVYIPNSSYLNTGLPIVMNPVWYRTRPSGLDAIQHDPICVVFACIYLFVALTYLLYYIPPIVQLSNPLTIELYY